MRNIADRSVVSKRVKGQAAAVTGVPRAKRSGGLVGEKHVILCVVEYSLCLVLLLAGGSSARVRLNGTTGTQLPQINQ